MPLYGVTVFRVAFSYFIEMQTTARSSPGAEVVTNLDAFNAAVAPTEPLGAILFAILLVTRNNGKQTESLARHVDEVMSRHRFPSHPVM